MKNFISDVGEMAIASGSITAVLMTGGAVVPTVIACDLEAEGGCALLLIAFIYFIIRIASGGDDADDYLDAVRTNRQQETEQKKAKSAR